MIYAVIAHQGADVLGATVARIYSGQLPLSAQLLVRRRAWIRRSGLHRLGIDNGKLPGVQAVVLPVTNYHGYAAGGLWTWLHSHWPG